MTAQNGTTPGPLPARTTSGGGVGGGVKPKKRATGRLLATAAPRLGVILALVLNVFTKLATITTTAVRSDAANGTIARTWFLDPPVEPPPPPLPRLMQTSSNARGALNELLLVRFNVTNPRSDIAELDHCDIGAVDDELFWIWYRTNMNEIYWEKLRSGNALRQDGSKANTSDLLDDIWEETTLQMLEMFAAASGLCDYRKYRPSIPRDEVPLLDEAEATLRSVPMPQSKDEARIAFQISAFKDVDHLSALLEAIHLPHHVIVIHLERSAPPDFVQAVRRLAQRYENIAILQFGSVVYPSDTISYIHLKIMRWIAFDLDLKYDYHVNICGAVYPLRGPREMARYLKGLNYKRIFMGRMFHPNGTDLAVRKASQRGLFYTRGAEKLFVRKRLLEEEFLKATETLREQREGGAGVAGGVDFRIRDDLVQHCKWKTNSGGNSAYPYDVVRKFLNSTDAMALFAHFKYGTSVAMDESMWGGAMVIIGRGWDVPKPGAMWQLWTCYEHSNNAILSLLNQTCYMNHFGEFFRYKKMPGGMEAWMKKNLKRVKRDGRLFARKFSSEVSKSVELREWIGRTLHDKSYEKRIEAERRRRMAQRTQRGARKRRPQSSHSV